MISRNLPVLSALCWLLFCVNAMAVSNVAAPNVVVIYVDDLDLDELRVLGNEQLMTPHIDRLAHEGMIFRQGYVTSTVCTPSRYGVLTGNYACRSVPLQTMTQSSWRHRCYPPGGPGNIHFNAMLAPGKKTIGNHLQEAGYVTGLVGKWHLGGERNDLKKERMLRFPKGVDPESPEGQKRIRAYYDGCCDYVKTNFGFDYVDAFYSCNARCGLTKRGYPKTYAEHNPEWITAKAREFIEQNKARPFFLYYALTLPHGEGHHLIEAIPNADPYLTPVGRLEKLPDSGMPSRDTIFRRLKEAKLPQKSAGMLWVDDAVGALLAKLDECGLAENTVVFFISDHGNYAKEAIYDGGARVPYFVKWPGVIRPGAESHQLVANIDVAPTLLEIASAPNPDAFDGRSILPLLQGEDRPVRDQLLLEVGYARAVVTPDWKYIALRFPEDEWPEIRRQGGLRNVNYNADSASKGFRTAGMKNYPHHYYDFDQLYDRRKDPGEQTNRFGDPTYQPVVAEMQERLRKELASLPHTFGELKPPSLPVGQGSP